MTRDLRLTPALVARIPNGVGAPPEAAGLVAATDTDHRQVLDDILRTPPGAPFYVFADGALIWNPGIPVAGTIPARLHGWRRSFCLGWMTLFRGGPDRPGLMLALDHGGACSGLVLAARQRRPHPVAADADPPRAAVSAPGRWCRDPAALGAGAHRAGGAAGAGVPDQPQKCSLYRRPDRESRGRLARHLGRRGGQHGRIPAQHCAASGRHGHLEDMGIWRTWASATAICGGCRNWSRRRLRSFDRRRRSRRKSRGRCPQTPGIFRNR